MLVANNLIWPRLLMLKMEGANVKLATKEGSSCG